MMRWLPAAAGWTALFLAGWPQPAKAQAYRTFTDRTAFQAATGSGLNTVDFEALEDDTTYRTLEFPGVVFSSTDGDLQDLLVISPELYDFPALRSRVLLSNRNANPMILDFSPQVNAVGLDVLCLPTGDGVVVTVEGDGGTASYPVPLTEGGPAFFGVIAAGGIRRVTVANPEGQFRFVAVDNVSYGALGDPLARCLDDLKAALAAGRADGSIRTLGCSLETKLATARSLLEAGRPGEAAACLRALGNEIRAQRGKKISAARADQLLAILARCLELLHG